jgi:hypothetical protein
LEELTFRDHLHTYLDKAKMEWTRLGIDLVLGLEADKKMDISNSMYLPEFLLQGVSVSTLGNKKLESEQLVLLADQQPIPVALSFWQKPVFIFGLVALLLFSNLIIQSGVLFSIQSIVEKTLFMSSGLFGCFLLFLWVGTDHQSMTNNLNLIWAFPLNLFLAFKPKQIPTWSKYYTKIYTVAVLVLFFVAIIKPGIIPFELFTLMLALSYRSWIWAKSIN